jgi:hypothetical protein
MKKAIIAENNPDSPNKLEIIPWFRFPNSANWKV